MELFSTSFESSLSLPTPPPKVRRERGGEGKKEDREGEKKDGGMRKGKGLGFLCLNQLAVFTGSPMASCPYTSLIFIFYFLLCRDKVTCNEKDEKKAKLL